MSMMGFERSLIFKFIIAFFLLLVPLLTLANKNELITAINQNDIGAVKTLLEKGEDLRELIPGDFKNLPSKEISELLLRNKDKPLNADRFILLVLSAIGKYDAEKKFGYLMRNYYRNKLL